MEPFLAETSTRDRPALWAHRSGTGTARRGGFRLLLGSGLVAAGALTIVLWWSVNGPPPSRRDAADDRMALLAGFSGVLLFLAVVGAGAALVLIVNALEDAPADDMDGYAGGRRVDFDWADRWVTTGRITMEGHGDARVTASRDSAGHRALPTTATVPGGSRVRVSVTREPLGEPPTYTVTTDESEHSIQVRGDEGRGQQVDWTFEDGRGTTLRWRHRAVARVPRITLLDARGAAWSVRFTGRTSLRAELPDEMEPGAAHALVLVVEDQVDWAHRMRAAASSGGGFD